MKSLRIRACHLECWSGDHSKFQAPWEKFPQLEELELKLSQWAEQKGHKPSPVELYPSLKSLENQLGDKLKVLRLCLRSKRGNGNYGWASRAINFRRYVKLEHLSIDYSMLNPVKKVFAAHTFTISETRIPVRYQVQLSSALPPSLKTLTIHHLPSDEKGHNFDVNRSCRALNKRKDTHYSNLQSITIWYEPYHYLPADLVQDIPQAWQLYSKLKTEMEEEGVVVELKNRNLYKEEALDRSVRLFWDFE